MEHLGHEFTLGLAFGDSLHSAATTLFQSLDVPFAQQQEQYSEQWNRICCDILPLEKVSTNGDNLYYGSFSLLLAHEDKTYQGALIASLSIPWGEAKGDEDQGGYHLVWTRDMVHNAMGLLAAGNTETPLRALIYLATSQQSDGGFPQNFWIDGDPYWTGSQLDEVALPILLAWHLQRHNALRNFDPYPMVIRAASYLMRHGPMTQQERWEEASGYSPSTLACSIAALICAACFARQRGDKSTAKLLEEYADFLECHIEAWTVTTQGTLVPEIKRHFIRIHPVDINNSQPDEDPNQGMLVIANRPPNEPKEFPAKEIVDAGFLELIRYGIRRPDDPLLLDSLDRPEAHLYLGQPTGSAMPLMWAHAEYIKLLRSAFDDQVFDFIPEVGDRYLTNRGSCRLLEIWKHNRQVETVQKGYTLRIQASASFQLRWSDNDWQTVEDTPSSATALGIEFVDISIPSTQQAPIRFTFFWTDSHCWEGQDYKIVVE